jgi:hypothetical protein
VAKKVVRSLREGRWGLERARRTALEIEGNRGAVRALVGEMFGEEPELRKRAADVARRITDSNPKVLWRYAEELAGLLAELSPEESRTRWHLGLVVARVAHSREQRLRAARLMELLIEDESNVARCSAVEGIGLLACEEASLRGVAEEMIERALRDGTKAMKSRARHTKRRLEVRLRVERRD